MFPIFQILNVLFLNISGGRKRVAPAAYCNKLTGNQAAERRQFAAATAAAARLAYVCFPVPEHYERATGVPVCFPKQEENLALGEPHKAFTPGPLKRLQPPLFAHLLFFILHAEVNQSKYLIPTLICLHVGGVFFVTIISF